MNSGISIRRVIRGCRLWCSGIQQYHDAAYDDIIVVDMAMTKEAVMKVATRIAPDFTVWRRCMWKGELCLAPEEWLVHSTVRVLGEDML